MDQAVHDFIVDKSPDNESSRFAQISGVTNGAGGSNPDTNRKLFGADVKAAAAVVATEHKSEN